MFQVSSCKKAPLYLIRWGLFLVKLGYISPISLIRPIKLPPLVKESKKVYFLYIYKFNPNYLKDSVSSPLNLKEISMRHSISITIGQFICLIFLSIITITGCSKQRQTYPVTEQKPVTDEYYGMKIVDNYRWLDNLADSAVMKWTTAQNAFSREYFDKSSALPAIRERLKQIYSENMIEYYSFVFRTKLFALKFQPPKDQPFIVIFDSPDNLQSEKVVVDPNAINPKGTTAIDWFVPSRDGRLLAVALSENGSEDGSVHVFDVSTGKQIPEVVPRAQYATGGGSLEWNKNGTGFYYTRYPQGTERPAEDMNFYQQVYFHKLGTPPSKDAYVIGKEFPRIAEIQLSSTKEGSYILARVANGDGGEFAHYLMKPDGKWIQLTQFSDKATLSRFGKNALYILSRNNAPKGKILALPLVKPDLNEAVVIVPESEVSISGIAAGEKHLYVVNINGGPSQLRMYDIASKSEKSIPILPVSDVYGLAVLNNDELLFCNESYLTPASWYRYNSIDQTVTKTPLGSVSAVDYSDTEVSREFATSKDGTKIPMNIIKKKGTQLDGKNPAVLYAYGGYGISETPSFSIRRRLWLDQDGIYIIANLRGGGEYGEEWHNQGKLTKKQNVFDDFIACAEYLIDRKYTSTSKLAIEGGSNGGLLMGAVLTQRPDLFKAVVSHVGIYDMLRVELFPNGAFNVTEFGTVKDPEQFKALYAYSPYHHVVDGTEYPAVLFMTGDNDKRVDPANSRKMIARLQAASSSNLPLLLRTDSNVGHGIGTGLSTRVLQNADMYVFLLDQLGMTYKPVNGK
jgi:prolyl oligopeptidase